MKPTGGGVVAAKGFRCSAVGAGIKVRKDALDLGMLLSDLPATAAAMFTTNRVQAAPVRLDRELVATGRKLRGVVVNAGNANACTGVKGTRDAAAMVALAAACTGSPKDTFLVASTGIIGRPMPMAKVTAGIKDAAGRLGRSKEHAQGFERAIMTTDLAPKSAAVEFLIGGRKVRLGGSCKGSGMIAPNMATMLAFLTTDCAISAPLLRKALREVVGTTFNCVTVDGDCSTNDSVLLLANGAAGNRPIRSAGSAYNAFRAALLHVSEELAKAIARDGEGATRFVEVRVIGARREADALRVARSIASSPLVKCAINGGDPNWGRIICAAGYSGAEVKPSKLQLRINGVLLFKGGMPTRVAPEKLHACMKPKEILIHLDLAQGNRRGRIWTCDFSREYVNINADYHT